MTWGLVSGQTLTSNIHGETKKQGNDQNKIYHKASTWLKSMHLCINLFNNSNSQMLLFGCCHGDVSIKESTEGT